MSVARGNRSSGELNKDSDAQDSGVDTVSDFVPQPAWIVSTVSNDPYRYVCPGKVYEALGQCQF